VLHTSIVRFGASQIRDLKCYRTETVLFYLTVGG